MNYSFITKPIIYGIVASTLLMSIYFGILTLVSGWSYTLSQFSDFWFFVVALAVGFGIQIGLYMYLMLSVKKHHDGKILGVTGTTSAIAMVSCCAHYLVNLLPILGVVGLVTIVSQYQIELFWLGIFFNLGGILYMINKIIIVKRT